MSTLQFLVERSASVNLQTERRTTPLMLAAKGGETSAVTFLMKQQSSDLALADEVGFTAAMHALAVGHLEVVRAILEHTKILHRN